MKISKLAEGRFLRKEDIGNGILVTFSHLTQENMSQDGQPADMQFVAHWQEANVKPMVLKITNAQLIAAFLGSDDTDDWVGKKIVLYHDPTIMMGHKLVGGIRARAPRNQPQANPVPAPVQSSPMPHALRETEPADNQDDVPF